MLNVQSLKTGLLPNIEMNLFIGDAFVFLLMLTFPAKDKSSAAVSSRTLKLKVLFAENYFKSFCCLAVLLTSGDSYELVVQHGDEI